MVLGMDEDYTRISLSTAELEEQDGDMLRDKVPARPACAVSESVYTDT